MILLGFYRVAVACTRWLRRAGSLLRRAFTLSGGDMRHAYGGVRAGHLAAGKRLLDSYDNHSTAATNKAKQTPIAETKKSSIFENEYVTRFLLHFTSLRNLILKPETSPLSSTFHFQFPNFELRFSMLGFVNCQRPDVSMDNTMVIPISDDAVKHESD